MTELEALLAEAERLRRDNQQLRALLNDPTCCVYGDCACHWCGIDPDYGHQPDCLWAAVMRGDP